MRIVNRISGIEGIVAGGSPTFKLPGNRRYHGLKLFTTASGVAAAVTAVIDRIALVVGGVTIRDVSTTRLLALSTLNGYTPATGELPIVFSEPARADKIDEQVTAWDMIGEGAFEVRLQIAAGATLPGVTGIAMFDYGQTLLNGKPVKNVIRITELTKNAVSGLNDFDNLPMCDPIQRIVLFAAGAINSVEVTADRNKVYEVTSAENARVLADYGLVGSAAAFPICFDFTEQITDALVIARDLNVRFDSAAAQAVTAVVEARAPAFI
ncbi:MAG: major capsid protein P2 [Opitutaceae bacterium]